MYRLRLFGGASLVGPTGPVSGRAGQRRPLALLALLGVADESGLSRARIVGHLWPETRERRARHLLSVALHAVRKALGSDAVVSVGDALVLDPEVVEVDVRAFDRALEAGEPERAVELYEGPFLDGFHVDGAPGFERWLDRRREVYARAYRSALEELAEREEAAGDWSAAAERWRELAAEAPFSSRVTLRLMAALDRAGDRPSAVRAARAHAARVEEELGLEPDPEVADLAERLENGEVERTEGVAARPVEERTVDGIPAAAEAGRERPPRASPAGRAGPDADSGGSGRPSGDAPPFRVTTLRAVVAAVLVVGLGTLAAASVLNHEAPAPDPKRVLVDVFENGTGDPALDELGRMAADWITQGLTYTGFVDVVTRGTSVLSGQSAVGPDEGDLQRPLVEVARANGTGTLVWGSFHRRGDSVVFRAHVTDAGDRRELASLEPVAASIEAPVAGLERLRDRVMAALATLTDPRLEKWQRHATKPPTFEAYRTFVEGLELHTTQQKFGEAAQRFRAAAALDSGFTMARLWEALALLNDRRGKDARLVLEELSAIRERLAPLDRAFLDYLSASRKDDVTGRLRAARRMVEIAPGSEYLKLAGSAALSADLPEEAVRHYERADPESGWLRGWTPYWFGLARAHLDLGNHEEALEVARRGQTLYPEDAELVELELQILGVLGRIDELEAAVEDVQRFEDASWYWLNLSRAHLRLGNAHEALEAIREGRSRYPDDAALIERELHCLGLLGRFEELSAVVAGEEAPFGDDPDLMADAAEELVAHGHEGRGRELYHMAIELRKRRIAAGSGDARRHRLALVSLLRTVGRLEEANEYLEALLADHPEDWMVVSEAALLRAKQGRREQAMAFLRRYGEVGGPKYQTPRAGVAALLGERERTMRLLRSMQRSAGLYRPFFRHSPIYREFWDYPPFEELLAREVQTSS